MLFLHGPFILIHVNQMLRFDKATFFSLFQKSILLISLSKNLCV